jgi:hypothetical protein
LSGVKKSGAVGWRLLGSNNRELGRSGDSYEDAEAALEAIRRLRGVALTAEAHLLHEQGSGLWVWHLEADDVPLANSGRGFRHERECRYNLEQFRNAAPSAPASHSGVPVEFPWQRAATESAQLGGTA